MKYQLRCVSTDEEKTTFRVMNAKTKMSAGLITLPTEEVVEFITGVWQGIVLWDGNIPKPIEELAVNAFKGMREES